MPGESLAPLAFCFFGVGEMPQVTGRLLSESEVAELLGKSCQTLRRWRRIGYGPTYTTVGKTPRYALTWVNAWLKSAAEVTCPAIFGPADS